MRVFGIIIIVVLACLVTWLLIDTVIGIVRKIKYKKQHKDEVDNTK